MYSQTSKIILLVLSCCSYALQAQSALPQEQISNFEPHINLNINVVMDGPLNALPTQNTVEYIIQNTPKINTNSDIFFIFADTLRQDYVQAFAPNIIEFSKQAITGKYFVNGTATSHSTYAIFHSQPSFIAFTDYLRSDHQNDKGALFFRMFSENGYKIYAFGTEVKCLETSPDPGDFNATIQNDFGYKTQLLENCKAPKPSYYPNTFEAKKNNLHTDQDIVDTFIKTFKEVEAKQSKKNLFFIYLYNAHNPYVWDKNQSIPFPEASKLYGMDIPEIFDNGTKEEIRKAYANSVHGVDQQFKRVIDFIKKNNKFDNSTIVFLSDHGESLGEKPSSVNSKDKPRMEKDKLMYLHGNSLYKEQLESQFAIKYPKERQAQLNKACYRKFLQGMDFTPSVLDGYGFDIRYLLPIMRGCSIFSTCPTENFRSFVTAMPNGTEPTNKLVLINERYKVQIQINDPDFYNAKSFTIINITDLNDNSIYQQEPFSKFGIDPKQGTVKDKEGLIQQIKIDFSEALSTLFSSTKRD